MMWVKSNLTLYQRNFMQSKVSGPKFLIVSFSNALMAASRWVMLLKEILDGVKAMSRNCLLALKIIRKSNQTLPWRKSNEEPIPGVGLQSWNGLTRVPGCRCMDQNVGSRLEELRLEDMTVTSVGASALRKDLKGVWAGIKKGATCLDLLVHPDRSTLQKPKV